MLQDRNTGFSQAVSDDITHINETNFETIGTISATCNADVITPVMVSRDSSTWQPQNAAPDPVDDILSRHTAAVAAVTCGNSAGVVESPELVSPHHAHLLRHPCETNQHLHSPSHQPWPAGISRIQPCGLTECIGYTMWQCECTLLCTQANYLSLCHIQSGQ